MRFAPPSASAADRRAARVARAAARIHLTAMALEWSLAGDAPPGALDPLYRSSREILGLAFRIRSAAAAVPVAAPQSQPLPADDWRFRDNPPLAPVAPIDEKQVCWNWPEWDLFGHDAAGELPPFWMARLKAPDLERAVAFGLALFPYMERNFGVEPRVAVDLHNPDVAKAGGFSGQGADRSVLAAVGSEFEGFASTPRPADPEPAKKPRAKRLKPEPKPEVVAPPSAASDEEDRRYRERVEGSTDWGGPSAFEPMAEVEQPRMVRADEWGPQDHRGFGAVRGDVLAYRVEAARLDRAEASVAEIDPDFDGKVVSLTPGQWRDNHQVPILHAADELEPTAETPAEAAAQVATIEAFSGTATPPAEAASLREPTIEAEAPAECGWWVGQNSQGGDLFWIRADSSAEAWRIYRHDDAQRTVNRTADMTPTRFVPMPGDRWIEAHPFIKEMKSRIAPPAASAPAAVPLRFKLVGPKGEHHFWFTAPSEDRAISASKATCRAENWACLPIAPDQWESLPDHFKSFHLWPGRPLSWEDSPRPIKAQPARPEPAAPLFKAPPAPPAPPGVWRYKAFDHFDEPSAIVEAPDMKAARRAFNRELPTTWQGKVSNCSDEQWAELLALGLKPIWRELGPDEPDLAAADEPPPPATSAEVAPSVELGIWDACIWNAGRLDRIGRASAPDLASARRDFALELDRKGVKIQPPKALIVRPTPDLVAAELGNAFALPRVELLELAKVDTLATAPGYPMGAPWWDVVAGIDEADSMAEVILGRFQTPDGDLALEFAARRFPMFAASQLSVTPLVNQWTSSLAVQPDQVFIPGLNCNVRAYLTSEVFEDGGHVGGPEPFPQAEPEPVRPSAPAPDPEPVPAASPPATDKAQLLRRTLTIREGMEGRWETLKQDGATDDEVKALLGRAFALGVTIKGEDGGGWASADGSTCCFVGGKSPRFWDCEAAELIANPDRREAYRGSELITATRQALLIPDERGNLPEPKRRPGRRKREEADGATVSA